MKKYTILLVATASVLMLAGCAKTVSAEEAKAFIKENYSYDKASEAISNVTYTTKTVTEKAEGIFKNLGTVGTTEQKDVKGIIDVIKESSITDDEGITYKIDGKKFEAHQVVTGKSLAESLDVPEEALKGKMVSDLYCTEYGTPSKTKVVYDVTVNYSAGGLVITGAYKKTITTTYTYTYNK